MVSSHGQCGAKRRLGSPTSPTGEPSVGASGSFAPDRLPVFGADPAEPAFIWCAGQGGFGIQTSPAIGALLAEQLGAPAPGGAIGAVDAAAYAPGRFGAR